MLGFSEPGPDNGPLVVFLHAVGINSWMWKPIIAHLPNMRALLIDLPGHGDSNHIPWISLENTAEQVAETIDQQNNGADIHLLGLSLGSYVGMTLLSQRPKTYETAMLSGMHAGGMPNKRLMKLVSLLTAPIAGRPFFARKTARMLGGKDADIENFVAQAGRTKAAAFRRATNEVVDYQLPKNAAQIHARVLVAAGSKEHPLIRSSLSEVTRRIPRARSIQVPGVGHGWSSEKSQLFAQTLRDHIETSGGVQAVNLAQFNSKKLL